ncbi:MAG TPA: DinB family protein [Terriglobales bacterium]
MQHNLENTIALLTHTPAALSGFVRDLPEIWTECNEGEASWTVFDVVGHLVYAERTNWMPRVKRLLESGERRAFDTFDREGYIKESQGRSLTELLDEFARLRSASIAELRALNFGTQDLDRRGLHPTFGPVTLSELLATWAAHDLTHLHQITRIMAYQYRETVGPFREFLGVMKCAPHRD